MRYIITIILLYVFLNNICYAQYNKITIRGFVKDAETDHPLSHVNIVVQGTSKGTVSDNNGYYKLNLFQLPVKLIFSCIGYKSEIIEITEKKSIKLNINLKQETRILEPVSIFADKVVNIIKGSPIYVIDYDFYDNNILLLALKNKNLNKHSLILINPEGDTICVEQIKRGDNLITDPLGYNRLITRKLVHELYVDSPNIHLRHPLDSDEYHELFDQIDCTTKEKFYLHQYYYRNQVLAYYYFDLNDSTYYEFRVIKDSKAIRMLYDADRWCDFGYQNEAHKRFEEMCFADPIFAPLVIVNDTICIINYVYSQIEYYSLDGKLLEEIPINFHIQNHWKEKIYVDKVKGKVYTLFKKSGMTTLKEIDLKKGVLVNTVTIPNFIYIENIKIKDGIVYFLYKEKTGQEYKQLYKMEI